MDARHSEFPVDLEELIFLRQQAECDECVGSPWSRAVRTGRNAPVIQGPRHAEKRQPV